MHKERRK